MLYKSIYKGQFEGSNILLVLRVLTRYDFVNNTFNNTPHGVRKEEEEEEEEEERVVGYLACDPVMAKCLCYFQKLH